MTEVCVNFPRQLAGSRRFQPCCRLSGRRGRTFNESSERLCIPPESPGKKKSPPLPHTQAGGQLLQPQLNSHNYCQTTRGWNEKRHPVFCLVWFVFFITSAFERDENIDRWEGVGGGEACGVTKLEMRRSGRGQSRMLSSSRLVEPTLTMKRINEANPERLITENSDDSWNSTQ